MVTQLQRELRQTRPFDSPAHEASLGLFRTADLLRRMLAAVVEPAGITPQQYNVLRILRGAGDAGLPTLDIAERMVEQAPGITRLLDRLEAKTLVHRERCPTDRRQVLCAITPEGRTLLQKLERPVSEVGRVAMAAIGVKGQRQLIKLLDTVRAAGTGGPARC